MTPGGGGGGPQQVWSWEPGRHRSQGVIVTHVAQAVLDGSLTPDQVQVLQRSADYGTGRDPITAAAAHAGTIPEGRDVADG